MTNASDLMHELATRKAMARLLPVLGIAYFMSYVDRTNVALAKTALEADIGLSAAAYGLGAGLFFVSYALLEVPSNLVLYRVGARLWITRIAVTWGAVSAAMMFVQNEWSFYLLRLLLGAAEAGPVPRLMYMVTLWFSQKHRVTMVGLIYTAPCIAIFIGSPMGGALMELRRRRRPARLAVDVPRSRGSSRSSSAGWSGSRLPGRPARRQVAHARGGGRTHRTGGRPRRPVAEPGTRQPAAGVRPAGGPGPRPRSTSSTRRSAAGVGFNFPACCSRSVSRARSSSAWWRAAAASRRWPACCSSRG